MTSTPSTMVPSSHSASTLSAATASSHCLSDLPASLRTKFRARWQRKIMAASKRESSKGYYALPTAFQSSLEWRATDTSTLDKVPPANTGETTMARHDHKTSSVLQRIMRGNIHRKRGAWKQMALRNRHEANPHHQALLQILKDAAQLAEAASAFDQNVPSEPSDDFMPAQELLKQIHCKNTVVQAYTCSSLAYVSPVGKLDANTAALRLQAYYRGLKTRRSTLLNSSMQQESTERLTRQTSKICLPYVSCVQQPLFERQVSNITISDLGDSTHHTCSTGLSSSNVNRSRSWIEEGIEGDCHDADDYLFVPDKLVRYSSKSNTMARLATRDSSNCGPLCDHFPGKVDRMMAKHDDLSKMVSTKEPACYPRQDPSFSTMASRIHDSNEDIQMTTSMVHASLDSYIYHQDPSLLAFNFRKMLQEINNIQTSITQRLKEAAAASQNHSGSQDVENLIDSMLEGDEDGDSPAESFFEEQSRIEKVSRNTNTLHQSEGSLDFSSTLQRREATFRGLNGVIPTSCFHLSLNSSSSRWDYGLPDPITISHLHPKNQLSASTAAVSTFLPVRRPPRKLRPYNVVVASNMESRNNNSLTSIFLSTESTEPSPTMPLRKASSHSTTHSTFQRKDGERSYQTSIPVPPLTRHAYRSSKGTFLESSSPQQPIRKVSTHHAAHFRQGDKALTCVPASQTCLLPIPPPASAGTILEDGPIQKPPSFPRTVYKAHHAAHFPRGDKTLHCVLQ